MHINPMNVINTLLTIFRTMHLPESQTTHEEIILADHLKSLLLDTIFHFNIEEHEENSLDFLEPFKDCEFQIIYDDDDNEDFTDSDETAGVCTITDAEIDMDRKRKAVEFWKNEHGKKKHKLSTVQKDFRFVSSERQLRRWAKQIEAGGTRKSKLAYISESVLNNFKSALNNGFIIHDRDLQRWALQANEEQSGNKMVFKASKYWLFNFKKAHGIVSRKITKFVTRKTITDGEKLKEEAAKFVDEIKPLVTKYGATNVYNSDQSGFRLEFHSGRTLTKQGEKTVECVAQSISSTTHSYTIQPLIRADGVLLSPLFLVLKEPSGSFGPIVQKTLFKPDNIFLTASKSGKLTAGN